MSKKNQKKNETSKPEKTETGTGLAGMRKFRAIFLSIIGGVLILGILGILAEKVSSQYVSQQPPPGKEQNTFRCMPGPNPDLAFLVLPNTSFLTFGVPYVTNEFGFRDIPTRPRESVSFRILCLGDSITFGTGVANEETFPNVIETKLNQRAISGAVADVINAGVSAFNTRNIRALLESQIENTHPNVVVYTFVENDLDDSYSIGPEGFMVEWDPIKPEDAPFLSDDYPAMWFARYERARNLAESNAIMKTYRQKMSGVYDEAPPLLTGDFPETQRRWAEFEKNLTLMRDLCFSNGASFLVYAFGTSGHSEPVNLRVRNVCQKLKIPYCSTLPLFNFKTYLKEYSLGFDPHCNPLGHQVMADRLLQFMEENMLIPTEQFGKLNRLQKYDESIDEAYSQSLESASQNPPDSIDFENARGVMGMIGGFDPLGNMARWGVVRLGGRGNLVHVELAGTSPNVKNPIVLTARINGVDSGQAVRVFATPGNARFPIPPHLVNQPVEVELVADGPSFIPTMAQRQYGAFPQTIGIKQIYRTSN